MKIPQVFKHSIDGYLRCFQLLAIANCAAMIILVQVFCCTYVYISLVCTPNSSITGWEGMIMFGFSRFSQFSKMSVLSYTPTSNVRGLQLFHIINTWHPQLLQAEFPEQQTLRRLSCRNFIRRCSGINTGSALGINMCRREREWAGLDKGRSRTQCSFSSFS